MALKIIFAGTPEFAVPTLQALLQSEHQVCAVYTQPDRPAGRGQKLTASAVKQVAIAHQIPVYQPTTLRDAETLQFLKQLQADVMIVVAYGLLLPANVLTIPRYGCINVHASLLPRWRGAAPIQRAILAGDKTTGVTIMQMNEGFDSGDMLKKISCPINDDDTSQSLHDHLAKLGAKALLETLTEVESGQLQAEPQYIALATYAPKLTKAEAELDWNLSAIELDRRVRAFNPWPIAYTQLAGQVWRIWKSRPLAETSQLLPGTIVREDKNSIDVATGNGILKILELQLPGGRRISTADFLNAKKQMLIPEVSRFE